MRKVVCFSLLAAAMLMLNSNTATAQCGQSGGFYYCSSYSGNINDPESNSNSWATTQTSFAYIYVNMIVDDPDGLAECRISFGNYYFSKTIDYYDNYFDDTFSGSSGTSVSSIYLDTYARGAESHISAGW